MLLQTQGNRMDSNLNYFPGLVVGILLSRTNTSLTTTCIKIVPLASDNEVFRHKNVKPNFNSGYAKTGRDQEVHRCIMDNIIKRVISIFYIGQTNPADTITPSVRK